MILSDALPRLRRFGRDETASLSVEAVLVVPFLIWAFLGLFMLTDAFRAIHSNTVSTYALGDALSREKDPVNGAYIEGLNQMHALMARAQNGSEMRASMVHFDAGDNRLEVEWSYSTGTKSALTTATLNEISARIPTLANGEAVVVVETWVKYSPWLEYLVGPMDIYEIVVTRPRYAPTVAWTGA